MDLYERIMELGSMGYHCSQIIMIMTLETIGEENPQLVKAMGGLGGGIGYCGDTCGCLTGSACAIGYFLGNLAPEEKEDAQMKPAVQELYQWFTDTYAHLSLQELKDMLNENINSIYAMIDSLSEEELFKPHMRKWADEATKTAVWEVYKFIHVNTVAPFGTFRTKIRKWKKIAL